MSILQATELTLFYTSSNPSNDGLNKSAKSSVEPSPSGSELGLGVKVQGTSPYSIPITFFISESFNLPIALFYI